MNRKQMSAKAEVIDNKKDKIFYAGAALLMGLVAAAFFSSNAKAQTDTIKKNSVQSSSTSERQPSSWNTLNQMKEEILRPFELKSQKLNH